MGHTLTVINDDSERCVVKVYTVGPGIQVGPDYPIEAGGKQNIDLGAVWYDIGFNFPSKPERFVRVWMGGDRTLYCSQARYAAVAAGARSKTSPFLFTQDLLEYLKLPSAKPTDDRSVSAEVIQTEAQVSYGVSESLINTFAAQNNIELRKLN